MTSSFYDFPDLDDFDDWQELHLSLKDPWDAVGGDAASGGVRLDRYGPDLVLTERPAGAFRAAERRALHRLGFRGSRHETGTDWNLHLTPEQVRHEQERFLAPIRDQWVRAGLRLAQHDGVHGVWPHVHSTLAAPVVVTVLRDVLGLDLSTVWVTPSPLELEDDEDDDREDPAELWLDA